MATLSTPVSTQRTFHRSLAVLATAAAAALLYYGRPFFVTIALSAMLAFVLDPIVLLVMRLRLPRPAATSVVIVISVVLAYMLSVIIWTQVSGLTHDLPSYTSRVSELIDKTSARLDDIETKAVSIVVPKRLRDQEQEIQQKPQEAAKARKKKSASSAAPVVVTPPATPQPPQVQEVRIKQEQRPAISLLYNYLTDYARALLMASFVPFLTYFMLSWRDHFRKSILSMARGEQRYVVGRSLDSIAESTRAYLLGNVILGLLLSAASAGIFFFFKVPYWPLIGLISGFFSLLPYVGLPLSMLPPLLAALAVPNKFTVILAIAGVAGGLHLVAMNLAYPKVVGRHVHLNPLAVTISLMFWTLMWGGIGLILAVPITAAIKGVCEQVESLQPVARLLGD